MFGFSLQKLLVLAAVIALVWYGFKFVGRLQDHRKVDGGLDAGQLSNGGLEAVARVGHGEADRRDARAADGFEHLGLEREGLADLEGPAQAVDDDGSLLANRRIPFTM